MHQPAENQQNSSQKPSLFQGKEEQPQVNNEQDSNVSRQTFQQNLQVNLQNRSKTSSLDDFDYDFKDQERSGIQIKSNLSKNRQSALLGRDKSQVKSQNDPNNSFHNSEARVKQDSNISFGYQNNQFQQSAFIQKNSNSQNKANGQDPQSNPIEGVCQNDFDISKPLLDNNFQRAQNQMNFQQNGMQNGVNLKDYFKETTKYFQSKERKQNLSPRTRRNLEAENFQSQGAHQNQQNVEPINSLDQAFESEIKSAKVQNEQNQQPVLTNQEDFENNLTQPPPSQQEQAVEQDVVKVTIPDEILQRFSATNACLMKQLEPENPHQNSANFQTQMLDLNSCFYPLKQTCFGNDCAEVQQVWNQLGDVHNRMHKITDHNPELFDQIPHSTVEQNSNTYQLQAYQRLYQRDQPINASTKLFWLIYKLGTNLMPFQIQDCIQSRSQNDSIEQSQTENANLIWPSLKSDVFTLQDKSMWMLELIPIYEDKFSAHLIIHAIEPELDEEIDIHNKFASMDISHESTDEYFPRKLLIQPYIFRHIQKNRANQFYFEKDAVTAIFTKDKPYYLYPKLFCFSQKIAENNLWDQILPLQLSMAPCIQPLKEELNVEIQINLPMELKNQIKFQEIVAKIEEQQKKMSGNKKNGVKMQNIVRNLKNQKRGIRNEGVTCYINSLFQALFSIDAFCQAVYNCPLILPEQSNGIQYQMVESEEVQWQNQAEPHQSQLALQDQEQNWLVHLQRIFYYLQRPNNDDSSFQVGTRQLIESCFGPDWLQYQQDTSEFWLMLSDKLEQRFKNTPSEGIIEHLFYGKQQSVTQCINVDYKSIKQDQFSSISLGMQTSDTIEGALRKYLSVEKMEGENQYEAEGHGKQDAVKFIKLDKVPPILSINLQRFGIRNNQYMKIQSICEFNQTLNLDQVIESCDSFNYSQTSKSHNANDKNQEKLGIYHLHAILVHKGLMDGGHYTCFINRKTDNQDQTGSTWIKFDDLNAQEVTQEFAFATGRGGYTSSFRLNEADLQENGLCDLHETRHQVPSQAYMLIYLRQDMISQLLSPEAILKDQMIKEIFEQEYELVAQIENQLNLDYELAKVFIVSPETILESFQGQQMTVKLPYSYKQRIEEDENIRMLVRVRTDTTMQQFRTRLAQTADRQEDQIYLYRLVQKGNVTNFELIDFSPLLKQSNQVLCPEKKDYKAIIYVRFEPLIIQEGLPLYTHNTIQVLKTIDQQDQFQNTQQYQKVFDFAQKMQWRMNEIHNCYYPKISKRWQIAIPQEQNTDNSQEELEVQDVMYVGQPFPDDESLGSEEYTESEK